LGNGEQTRDFIFVKDVVQANLLAAQHAGDVFNVASGQRITINELARLIIELTDSKSKIDYQPARTGDIIHSQADNSKIAKSIGFKPAYSLVDALTETIKDFYETSTAFA
jgi:UDP-glucose 4-epimerase